MMWGRLIPWIKSIIKEIITNFDIVSIEASYYTTKMLGNRQKEKTKGHENPVLYFVLTNDISMKIIRVWNKIENPIIELHWPI